MRFCSKCFQCKDEIQFSKRTASKDGLGTRCKECDIQRFSLRPKDYLKNLKTKVKVIKKIGYINGVLIDNTKTYIKQRLSIKKNIKKPKRINTTKKIGIRIKKRGRPCKYNICGIPVRLRIKKHTLKQKNTIKTREEILANERAIRRRYRAKHKDKINATTRIYIKNKKQNDPLFKLEIMLRSRLNKYLKYKKDKIAKCTDRFGADINVIKKYIEVQFKKGMTWDNHGNGEGKWHIDHKIPLSSAKTHEELMVLFHYRNLQPLWAKDNQQKKDKILPFQVYLPI